jgi:hypothetical protein
VEETRRPVCISRRRASRTCGVVSACLVGLVDQALDLLPLRLAFSTTKEPPFHLHGPVASVNV